MRVGKFKDGGETTAIWGVKYFCMTASSAAGLCQSQNRETFDSFYDPKPEFQRRKKRQTLCVVVLTARVSISGAVS